MINREYLRSVMFGVEDSLVSTTGLIAGISIGANNGNITLLAGLVAVTIEALSMGIGEYLSDDAVEELDKIKRHQDAPLKSGLLMFFSYLCAGAIPLTPIAFLPFPNSLIVSVIFSLIALFLLGYIKGRLLKTSAIKGGLKIFILGGITTVVGVIVGMLFKI